MTAPSTTPVVAATSGRRPPLRIRLGGVPVDLTDQETALDTIRERSLTTSGKPLGVVSVNLDHIHHFGRRSAVHGAFGLREGERSDVAWLHLVDGAPVAAQAKRVTGRAWPRLAGSDLIDATLDAAAADGLSVGFLGGSPQTQTELVRRLDQSRPTLRLAGTWSPSRADLLDVDRSVALTEAIAAAGVDVLVVCLGKPRQELWIDRYGAASGARVLLAFGAVVDFLAGHVARSPEWVAAHGGEWAWRLALEPRRLARRYLVQGPPAYRELRRREPVAAP